MPWRMSQEPESLVLPAEVTGGGSRCSTACRVGDGEVSGPLRASSRGSKERGVHRLWQETILGFPEDWEVLAC